MINNGVCNVWQILNSVGMVIFERLLLQHKSTPPMLLSGYIGTWGLLVATIAIFIAYFVPGDQRKIMPPVIATRYCFN
jgi:hypothetical protein